MSSLQCLQWSSSRVDHRIYWWASDRNKNLTFMTSKWTADDNYLLFAFRPTFQMSSPEHIWTLPEIPNPTENFWRAFRTYILDIKEFGNPLYGRPSFPEILDPPPPRPAAAPLVNYEIPCKEINKSQRVLGNTFANSPMPNEPWQCVLNNIAHTPSSGWAKYEKSRRPLSIKWRVLYLANPFFFVINFRNSPRDRSNF